MLHALQLIELLSFCPRAAACHLLHDLPVDGLNAFLVSNTAHNVSEEEAKVVGE